MTSAIRDQICYLGRSLYDRGYTHGASGNISVLLDDGTMLLTPTNVSLGALNPTGLAHVDRVGRSLDTAAPTKELPLHRAMYTSRATGRAIVHLHSTHSVAVSILPDVDPADVLPPLTAYYLMRVGRTALLPYFRPGDPRVAEAIASLDGAYGAILLANHGPIVAGTSLEEAGWAIEELEQTAKLHLLTYGLSPKLIESSEANALRH